MEQHTSWRSRLLPALLLLSTAWPAPAAADWPEGPFTASGRWITDASGSVVQYAGVNWPGHTDAMIPEGLQYQSIEAIVSSIKKGGFNAVRLTYATEMIDQIEANDNQQNNTLSSTINAVFGSSDGTALLDKIMKNNPSLSAKSTRLDVFDAVAAECARQQIYIHLDNHVSRAGWCCDPLDGNSWWGDTYFDADNWTRGLAYMAEHGKKWPALMSMSLRNELRPALTTAGFASDSPYTWQSWYNHSKAGASAIHTANPNLLIFLSGLDGDTSLTPIVTNAPLTPSTTQLFSRQDFAPDFSDKLILELHAYWNIAGGIAGGSSGGTATGLDDGSQPCSLLESWLDTSGFSTLSANNASTFPILLTEFGFDMSPSNNATLFKQQGYTSCLLNYMTRNKISWMIWSLGGSYYTREGKADADEPWGLLNHDWSDWRAGEFINEKIAPLVKDTLASGGQKPPSAPPAGSAGSAQESGQGNGAGRLIGAEGMLRSIMAVMLSTLGVLVVSG